MIHAQCEEMGNRNIWKESWQDKTADTHGKGRVCAGPYHPHQTGREHPQSLQTNMHGPESWSQTQLSPGELCLLRNAVTFHTEHPVVRPD